MYKIVHGRCENNTVDCNFGEEIRTIDKGIY